MRPAELLTQRGKQAGQPTDRQGEGCDPVERDDALEARDQKCAGAGLATGRHRPHDEAADDEEQVNPACADGEIHTASLSGVEYEDAQRGCRPGVLNTHKLFPSGRGPGLKFLHACHPVPILCSTRPSMQQPCPCGASLAQSDLKSATTISGLARAPSGSLRCGAHARSRCAEDDGGRCVSFSPAVTATFSNSVAAFSRTLAIWPANCRRVGTRSASSPPSSETAWRG